ncbi:DUF2922 domain-containing protein [Lentilactobacillus kisonensis]|uniref:DUF2922 domain-containing protein n=1 Tax=Lentilactobacillus kisonensis DSM 19906 = JCM 15041 TaxID=1423766 RepID=A0A0R1NUL5_9LACO|nr:DUF2922 domain-containing protein [Lentilactobacillus kisonensis]KRL20331.1 hypothetical protein FC98_GL001743 [Lentilactobacillus kisonensis DSM 19906 = JCM 15041]
MKKLELVFKSSDDKLKTMTINYANDTLEGTDVQKQMSQIAALNMFQKDGVNLYATPVAAQYRSTNIESLFDNRDEKKA